MKKIPLRTCMGCNEKRPKKELIRIVKQKDGNVELDKTVNLEGRGAYICNNIECLNKVIKTKRLERTLDIQISEETYKKLRGVIIGE